MSGKWKVVGWVGCGAVAGALTTMQFSATARQSPMAALPLEELQQLATVFQLVKAGYVQPVDDSKLINSAIAGMVGGLDPHSSYIEAKQYGEFREGLTGKFVGVGVQIEQDDGALRVVAPIEGTPAARAGLRPNDLITRVDDTPVRGLSQDQAIKRIRGEPKTQVTLTIYRKSESRSFPVTLIREEIQSESVRAKLVQPGYGWIRVSNFQEQTLEEFARKAADLAKQEPQLKGLVLDLRNDPGGALDGAIGLSAAFLPAGVEVTSTKGQVAAARYSYRAIPQHYLRGGRGDPLKALPALFKSVPLVVLVNEGSASASEIVAGALQDHKRATIMGAPTFGKGSVQTIHCLPLGTRLDDCKGPAVKLTTAHYYTPSDRNIQARGIVPDLALDETAEGNLIGALRMREADLEKHLASANAAAEAEESKAREAERRRLEAQWQQRSERGEAPQRLPEYGSAEDWPLQQAMNHLQGRPVVLAKAAQERKAEAPKQP